MTTTYKCELCEKVFKQKGDFTKHKKRTSACVSLDKLKILTTDNKFNIITALNKCLNILRDEGNVLGEDALHIISYFLILGLMESKLEQMDMYNEEHYQLDELDQDGKTKLFHVLKFSNLINENKTDYCRHLTDLWSCILSAHPLTKDIFKGTIFGIDKDDILQSILETLSKIKFSDIDQDILGDAYEEVVKNTLLQGDGQFFTPPFIKDIAVELVCPKVFENGKIETIFDPAMGTGGFLLTCLKFIKNTAKLSNIKLDWTQITSIGLGGREVIDKTFQFAKANCLVYSGHIFKTIEMNDSIRNPITKKYDCIVANPPYGIKGLSYDKIKNTNRDEYLPIVSNSAVPLFLEAIINMLNINGRCAIVIPNGQELFSKTDDLFNIRQLLLKSCELREVIYFNDKAFKKTSIKVCILFFVKKVEINQVLTLNKKLNKLEIENTTDRQYQFINECQTDIIRFYDYEQKTNSKKLLGEITIDTIINKNYSLNYRDYIIEETISYGNDIVVKTLGECCHIIKGIKKRSKDGTNTGLYPLYYCSILGNLYLDTYDYEGEGIIINKTNGSGKAMVYYGSNKYNIGETTLHFKSDKDNILTKYIYYYLLHNIPELEKYYKGCNQKSIVEDDLFKIKIPIPPLHQQEEAIEYLDFIYEKCNKTSNKKIDELQQLNQSTLLMQKILGQNEIKTLGCICEFKNGKGIKKENLIDGEYPVIGGGQKPMGLHNEYNTDENVILCSSSGAYAGYISKYNKKVWASDCFSIKPNNNNINNNYLYYLLKLSLQDNIYKLQTGTAQPHIYSKNLENIKIYIPSLERQSELIIYLESNDNLIKQLENEIINNKTQAKLFLSSIIKIVNLEQNEQNEQIDNTNCILESIESIDANDTIELIEAIEAIEAIDTIDAIASTNYILDKIITEDELNDINDSINSIKSIDSIQPKKKLTKKKKLIV
jgi:type I restriction enzyme S subunit